MTVKFSKKHQPSTKIQPISIMHYETNTVQSPCTGYCQLDQLNICLGCFRELNEIINWSLADDKVRNLIRTNAIARKKNNDSTYSQYT